MSKGLLLDTHIWLWFAQPERRLKKPGRVAILGRIHLGAPIDEWMKKALALPGLQCLQLEPALIFDAHRLPGDFHRDHIDRLLVATARHHSLTLITEDRKILDYATLPASPARR